MVISKAKIKYADMLDVFWEKGYTLYKNHRTDLMHEDFKFYVECDEKVENFESDWRGVYWFKNYRQAEKWIKKAPPRMGF